MRKPTQFLRIHSPSKLLSARGLQYQQRQSPLFPHPKQTSGRSFTVPSKPLNPLTTFIPSSIQQAPSRPRRIVVGITGATGAPYAIALLRLLRQLGIETHVVISKWALATLKYETTMTEEQIRSLAYANYTARDVSAPIASGSFQHDGMVIVPCSMKTLAAVRSGYCDDLISRAADVTLKENRRLLMAVRETPLSDVHLDNMLFLRRAGAIIFPPVPAFYTNPDSLEDVVDQSVGRMLDLMGIHTDGFERWDGFKQNKSVVRPAQANKASHA
ncbi:probable PAD1-phenylacrylic acid decarboxylase [Fusarium fujikuroi]|uniref:Flavin prenyltransferase PAD1, mitochondrial n=1 Tax=Fusarium fujikuroi TaxID=5127 RepID=A0A5Q3ENP3_FUSFU|nr:hypothetical protein CEK27_006795 [Fusarium fujikuroi]QGI79995.1 hypothetical protein CEK25_006724 [Fusarium fujikuroi]QGI93713.1 hypothetical protein CEK26_006782 [Fusarium fujikuroi]SCN80075.1 probable PAD1-phenylacrylic acid decarboxylase [Fusarium fujikuroi]SCO06759.1 probable PAD1-phenylacrylic acid decarboxylase [Fusarium fujikuroi]